MIPKLWTFPEKQINKPKTNKKHLSPSVLPSISRLPSPPLFHCFNKLAVIFSGIKITACFSISLEQQLIDVIVSICLLLNHFFLSIFCISFSLSSSLYNSLTQKEQYFSPMHSSVHYSLYVKSIFLFWIQAPKEKKIIPFAYPSQICTQFLCQQNLSVSLNIFSFYFMS